MEVANALGGSFKLVTLAPRTVREMTQLPKETQKNGDTQTYILGWAVCVCVFCVCSSPHDNTSYRVSHWDHVQRVCHRPQHVQCSLVCSLASADSGNTSVMYRLHDADTHAWNTWATLAHINGTNNWNITTTTTKNIDDDGDGGSDDDNYDNYYYYDYYYYYQQLISPESTPVRPGPPYTSSK